MGASWPTTLSIQSSPSLNSQICLVNMSSKFKITFLLPLRRQWNHQAQRQWPKPGLDLLDTHSPPPSSIFFLRVHIILHGQSLALSGSQLSPLRNEQPGLLQHLRRSLLSSRTSASTSRALRALPQPSPLVPLPSPPLLLWVPCQGL